MTTKFTIHGLKYHILRITDAFRVVVLLLVGVVGATYASSGSGEWAGTDAAYGLVGLGAVQVQHRLRR